jgi:RimJ/RimL family protein N-acetyltransferase
MADELRTERLLLRRARWDDLTAIHGLLSNSRALRYWSSPAHTDIEQTERWLTSMIEADPAKSDDFVVTLRGEVIGKLGAWLLPEIGYLLNPSHWGKGYAREGLAAFIARRRALGSSELTADVDPRNTSSLKLLEHLGFSETGRATGTWLVGNELCDSVYFRLNIPQD